MTIPRIQVTLLFLLTLTAVSLAGCGLSTKKMALDVEIIDGCIVRIKEAKMQEAGSIVDRWTIGDDCTVNVGSTENKK
jgi:hypothetical protein